MFTVISFEVLLYSLFIEKLRFKIHGQKLFSVFTLVLYFPKVAIYSRLIPCLHLVWLEEEVPYISLWASGNLVKLIIPCIFRWDRKMICKVLHFIKHVFQNLLRLNSMSMYLFLEILQYDFRCFSKIQFWRHLACDNFFLLVNFKVLSFLWCEKADNSWLRWLIYYSQCILHQQPLG